ncbi:lipase family protein [Rodentibacter sp. Ppn85]|uniref:lipase family protein n=1 Tax=Rodentibacter sp. Ppn85 TaxID=1908525 RepID=UPI000987340C|nr:lipase family protein [Rodentibacter sp. Ppn85]OOF60301.1 hypothetical protein BKL51_11525 [Rodentibacter sp. Ppn85]
MTVHNGFSIINDCRELEYSLWLKHTDKYNYINAYNLGYLSKLAYSKVILDNQKWNLDFQHFIDNAREPFRDCEVEDWTKIKLTSIKNEKDEISTNFKPFIDVFLFGNNQGIQNAGYVDDKTVSVSALFYMDETRAVIAVRGTQEIKDFEIDADALQMKPDYGIKGEVHKGFYTQANKIISTLSFTDFTDKIREMNKELYVTGHSLGGAVATILSAYLVEQGFKPLLYTFGSPRVGNTVFAKYYSDKFTHFRHVNDFDIVPVLPGRVLDGNLDKILTTAYEAQIRGDEYPFMTGIMSLFNKQKDYYTHHGNLCQIVGDEEVRMILPFSLHEINQIKMAALSEDEVIKKEDRTHSVKFNIHYHSMDTYLSNIEAIIKLLYHFYKVNNHCMRESIENCQTHSLHHFIALSKEKLMQKMSILQDQINDIQKKVQEIARKTNHALPLPSSTFRNQEKKIKVYKELLKKLEQVEKIKIDQYELYSLHIGNKDIAKQLNDLIE